jgi:ribosomal protein S18 acetylase RimI-like enzyme
MIRKAQTADFDSVTRIRQSLALDLHKLGDTDYKVQIQRSGFLLPLGLTIEEFLEDIEKYIVYVHDEEVVGYLRVDEEQEIGPDNEVIWFRPDLKDLYFSKPHADIGGVGVLPEASQHGLATKMLHEVEKQVHERGVAYLFSFVVLSPVTNFPSMMFHEKNGFERIAVLVPKSSYGMEGYQSLLYGKKLL